MNIPPPTERQSKIIWLGATVLALAIVLGAVGFCVWGLGRTLNTLSPVLLPLAIAGILAYLLDPVVHYFAKKMPRNRAIVLVFALAVLLVGGLLGTVVPRLIVETRQLVEKIPAYSKRLQERVNEWISTSPLVRRVSWELQKAAAPEKTADAQDKPDAEKPEERPAKYWEKLFEWGASVLPAVGGWILEQLKKVASWFGRAHAFSLSPFLTQPKACRRAIPSGRNNHLSRG